MRVGIAVHTPSHQRVTTARGDAVLLSHELPPTRGALDVEQIERHMAGHVHEWSAIVVEHAPRRRLIMWRSLTSHFDVFYCRQPGSFAVSDCVVGSAAALPPAQRSPT